MFCSADVRVQAAERGTLTQPTRGLHHDLTTTKSLWFSTGAGTHGISGTHARSECAYRLPLLLAAWRQTPELPFGPPA